MHSTSRDREREKEGNKTEEFFSQAPGFKKNRS
jgi:hypothetical protein